MFIEQDGLEMLSGNPEQEGKPPRNTFESMGNSMRSHPRGHTPVNLQYPDLQRLNLRYAVSKNASHIMPKLVFDDGRWTYFQFGTNGTLDGLARLPTVYATDAKKQMSIANSRIEQGFLIVGALAPYWTLKSADDIVCIKRFEK